ncbi:methyltransferase [Chlorella sorokiniana]|uniref:Methyltransferase n=1 Tax=Chlorella sorokiniana TaxID=3076 RepID=A0A2P6U0D5_CHLSO|nr:methyltransferase [Chlorella sorokiniana]|eukprot:PRW59782.1 methyltransferase [Chlorella sorokiniana]
MCPIAECAPAAVALSPEFESAFCALVQGSGHKETSLLLLSASRSTRSAALLAACDGLWSIPRQRTDHPTFQTLSEEYTGVFLTLRRALDAIIAAPHSSR